MAVNKEKSEGLVMGDRTNDGTIGQATQQHRNSRSPGARRDAKVRKRFEILNSGAKQYLTKSIDNKSKQNRSIAAGAAAEQSRRERALSSVLGGHASTHNTAQEEGKELVT